MQLHTIVTAWLLALATQALACYTEILNATTPEGFNKRATGGIQYSNKKPWPLTDRKGNFPGIPICFATVEVRDKMRCAFLHAVDVWLKSLGGLPTAETGHGILWSEHPSNHPCFIPGTFDPNTGTGQWNPNVPPHFLAIIPNTSGVLAATIGFTPDGPGGKHWLRFDPNIPVKYDFIGSIAHEVGHVFGMLHEHQRSDRDNYVQTNWEAIIHYKEALKKMMDEGVSEEESKYGLQRVDYYSRKYRTPTSAFMTPFGGEIGGARVD